MRKNRYSIVLSLLLACTVVISSFVSLSSASVKLGDIDGDGFVSSGDARKALRASVGLESFTAEQKKVADVDKDGFVTSADARFILRASVGLEKLPDDEPDETTEEPTTLPPIPETTTEEPTTVPPIPETTTEEPTTLPPIPETTTEEPTTVPPTPETTTEEPTTQPYDPEPVISAENEYYILKRGTFYFIGRMIDSNGPSTIEFARTPDSIYFGSEFNEKKVAILRADQKLYMVSPENDAYLDLNSWTVKNTLKLAGIDVDTLGDASMLDFSLFPDFGEESFVESTEINGMQCTRHGFVSDSGTIVVTMCGDKLICIENAADGNTYRLEFDYLTEDVPEKMKSVKSIKSVSIGKFVLFFAS